MKKWNIVGAFSIEISRKIGLNIIIIWKIDLKFEARSKTQHLTVICTNCNIEKIFEKEKEHDDWKEKKNYKLFLISRLIANWWKTSRLSILNSLWRKIPKFKNRPICLSYSFAIFTAINLYFMFESLVISLCEHFTAQIEGGISSSLWWWK